MADTTHLLEVTGLCVDFRGIGWRAQPNRVVHDVTFHIDAGETVAMIGESGSGKSTIGRAVLGLVRPSGGTIRLGGADLGDTGAFESHATDLQAVFQDPFSSLNPARTVGATLREPLEVVGRLTTAEAAARIADLLTRVSLPPDSSRRYPRSFSGGQRQRIGVARALSVSPRLIVCDEATSALDVITQASTLELLRDVQARTGVAYLFIAHNLRVVAGFADRVVVLYRGRVMEQGPAAQVHGDPRHPYTRALLAAAPVADPVEQRRRRTDRAARRSVTTAAAAEPPPAGCPFAPRCPSAADPCWQIRPRTVAHDARTLACHLFDPDIDHPASTDESRSAS